MPVKPAVVRSLPALVRGVLLVGAVLRVARFLTTDTAGEWWVVGPAKRWAWRQIAAPELQEQLEAKFEEERLSDVPTQSPHASNGWQAKLVQVFDCGYCLTPWLTGGALIGEATLGRIPIIKHVWRWLTATLALSWVLGHVWHKMDAS